MKYEKYLLILGCAIFLCLFSNSHGENRDEIVQKIVIYEKKFKSCIIKYVLNTYSKSEKEYVSISPTVESVFSSNGRFKRLDLVYKHERRGEITYRKISNGETYSNWHFDPLNVPGDATIEPATKNTDSMFPSKYFYPFTYYNGNKNDVTISVKDELVDLSWKDSETGLNIKGTYKLEGESHLPAEYIVTTVLPDGKEEIATRISYEREGAYLKQITVYHPPHNIKQSYLIREIEYNPTFPQEHFAITFRDGTNVFDKSLNARYRYEESFNELKETTNHKVILKYLYAIVILAMALTAILVCKRFLTKPKRQQ